MSGFPRWLAAAGTARRNHARPDAQSPAQARHHAGADSADRPLRAGPAADGLDRHFASHRFLFGDRPSLGDYGLIGPLYAHLGRDPWPKRELIEPRRHLRPGSSACSRRRNAGRVPDRGPHSRDAEAGVALDLRRDGPVPGRMRTRAAQYPGASGGQPQGAPFLDEVRFPLSGATYRQPAFSYPVWMVQRLLEAFRRDARDRSGGPSAPGSMRSAAAACCNSIPPRA